MKALPLFFFPKFDAWKRKIRRRTGGFFCVSSLNSAKVFLVSYTIWFILCSFFFLISPSESGAAKIWGRSKAVIKDCYSTAFMWKWTLHFTFFFWLFLSRCHSWVFHKRSKQFKLNNIVLLRYKEYSPVDSRLQRNLLLWTLVFKRVITSISRSACVPRCRRRINSLAQNVIMSIQCHSPYVITSIRACAVQ